MCPRIAHQLRGRVEAHRLAVEERSGEDRGVMAFHPGGGVGQQGKAGTMTFREAVFAETLYLAEDPFGEFPAVTTLAHSAQQTGAEMLHCALALPVGHGTAQL